MELIKLYNGSIKINNPTLVNKDEFDYIGEGLYCYYNLKEASKQACLKNEDGFVNVYSIDLDGLSILDITNEDNNILKWMALILKNKCIDIEDEYNKDSIDYLINNFYVDTHSYDAIIMYNPIGTYYSLIKDFINNKISLKTMKKILFKQNEEKQFVILSNKAKSRIYFDSFVIANKEENYPAFKTKDEIVREEYYSVKEKEKVNNEIYMANLVIGGYSNETKIL